MKLYNSLLLTFLVQAQTPDAGERIVWGVCTGSPLAITLSHDQEPIENNINPFSKEKNVKLCREITKADIFTSWQMKPDSNGILDRMGQSYNIAHLNNINQYISQASKFYRGVSLEISSLDTDHVRRLLQQIPNNITIALELSLDRWEEVKDVINNSQANINHIVLFLEDEEHTDKLLEVYNSCPKAPISVLVKSLKQELKDLTKKVNNKCTKKKFLYSIYQKQNQDLSFSSFQTFEI
ncbi:hypothetical protein DSO57_1014517 [Entomophthora muscae]|uniref:Uncharacterized protein n=1 Tax=Entomophthora muscae TaxID=34485 RepID=A0ACC2T5H5_9FUNG|nr:hypothetical protein DSO57_1014517 [Entomophthora muscae]